MRKPFAIIPIGFFSRQTLEDRIKAKRFSNILKCAYQTTLLYHRHQFFVNTNFNFANVQIYFKLFISFSQLSSATPILTVPKDNISRLDLI